MRTQIMIRVTAIAFLLIAVVACATEPTPTATVVPTATEPPPTATEAPPTATPTEEPPTVNPTPTEAAPTPTEAAPTMTPTPTEPAPTPTPELSDGELISMGQEVYTTRCQTCHQPQGEGVPGAYPPLAGSPFVTAEDPTAAIERVLVGRGAMPGFRFFLSDQEIAAVLSFVRSSWENDASMVTIEEVEQVRGELGSE